MKLALFSYGFRPFFLLTGLYAVIAVAIWLLTLFTGTWPDNNLPPYLWHGHEMIFGFVAAAIAGFLLTAVPSWTGQPLAGSDRVDWGSPGPGISCQPAAGIHRDC